MLGFCTKRDSELAMIRCDIEDIKTILGSELLCLEEKIKKIEEYLQISKKETPAKKADWKYVTDKKGK